MSEGFWYGLMSTGMRPKGRPDLSVILPELLVGEYLTPKDLSWLRATHGVTAVLSLQDEADLASKGLDLRALESAYVAHGLRFRRVAVPDCDADVLQARLDQLVALLDDMIRGGERVYLHCNAGMNRAPTVAIAYLHVQQGLPLHEAKAFVKQRRHCVPYLRVLEAHYGAAPAEE